MRRGEFELAWRESNRSESSFGDCDPFTRGHLLIRCRRGLGDAIQFLRYAPLLKRTCSRLTVEAPAPGLLPLLRLAPAVDEAVEKAVGEFACEVECSDLPYVFRTALDTIPDPLWFRLPPREWQGRRADVVNVGLVWAAGEWNPSRSIPADLLLPLGRLPGLAVHSLQRGPRAHELAGKYGILDAERNEPDILHTAAVIQQLDLVITVDTMVAHLAGALGRPVWLMLADDADWRWMLDRDDSPWYPAMRLMRQPAPGDWASVAEAVIRNPSAGDGQSGFARSDNVGQFQPHQHGYGSPHGGRQNS